MARNRVHVLVIASLTVLALVVFTPPLFSLAQTVHVKGYTKKDGTVVKPHDRQAPSSTATSPTPASSTTTQATPEPPAGELPSPSAVFVVAGPPATALYHRVLCPWLNAKAAILTTYTVAEAEKRFFQPHCLCITGREGVPPCTATALVTGATGQRQAALPPAEAPLSPSAASGDPH